MAMTIGACTIELRIFGAASLKDKRSVLKPILSRLRQASHFPLSGLYPDHRDSAAEKVGAPGALGSIIAHFSQ